MKEENLKNQIKLLGLLNKTTREKTFSYIVKNKSIIPNLETYIAEIPQIMTVFTQEIINCYSLLFKSVIEKDYLVHCYNFISVFQLLVSNNEIRASILKSKDF